MIISTRNNIFYMLERSPFYVKANGLTFVFSSQMHMNKFEERLTDNRRLVASYLKARYRVTVNSDLLADIVLYNAIERRGFLISMSEPFSVDAPVVFRSMSEIILNMGWGC